jgi:hypothetical protein
LCQLRNFSLKIQVSQFDVLLLECRIWVKNISDLWKYFGIKLRYSVVTPQKSVMPCHLLCRLRNFSHKIQVLGLFHKYYTMYFCLNIRNMEIFWYHRYRLEKCTKWRSSGKGSSFFSKNATKSFLDLTLTMWTSNLSVIFFFQTFWPSQNMWTLG